MILLIMKFSSYFFRKNKKYLVLHCILHNFPYICPMKPTLKDLRTTYRVLEKLDYPVPPELLVTLADKIKAEEKSRHYRKLAKMSEEDLIRYQSAPKRRIRINLPDGRIIQEKTNEDTFYTALRELDFAAVLSLGLTRRGTPIFVGFSTPRRQLNGHKMLHESHFVQRISKPDERLNLLYHLDNELQLNWEILLL